MRRLWLLPALSVLTACSGPGWFEDAAELSDLEHVSYSGDHLWYLIDTLGAGAAAGDYDGDGDADLFLCTGHAILDSYQEEANEHSNALWRNEGGGRFTDITGAAGLMASGWSNGAVFADHDGDGDLDLYVARHGPNLLYRNDGGGSFTEIGRAAGVDDPNWSAGGFFADHDGDGDLDLYVTNYAEFKIEEQKGTVDWFDKGLQQFPQHFPPADNRLYRNDGDGNFTDVTRDANAQGSGRSLGAVWTDVEDDGDLDLFVANDVGFNNLLVNEGGKFVERGFESGLAANANGDFEASMGVAAGDYDSDGDVDILVTNYAAEPNTLYRNEGGGFFTDVTRAAKLVDQRILDTVGWGAGFHDFDLDGNLDLLVINGHVLPGMVLWYMRNFYTPSRDDIRQMGPDAFNSSSEQPKLLFLGNGDGTFTDVTDLAGAEIWDERMGRGAAFADFDGDGRVDVAVSNKNDSAQVLLNRMVPRGNWVVFDLRAPSPNVFAVGARVTLVAAGRTQVREVYAGTSYLSGDDLGVHFGLGGATRVDRVVVRWPGGRVDTWEALPVNQRIRLSQAEGLPGASLQPAAGK